MKRIFLLLSAAIFISFQSVSLGNGAIDGNSNAGAARSDSSVLRISNNSSLKQLPSVLHDLSIAISQSSFVQQKIINEEGFTIELQDAASKTSDTSAVVNYRQGDTVFYVTLNPFNRQASDLALAVTLIHEIMHCVLVDIDKRGRAGDQEALSTIRRFNQGIKDPLEKISNPFFDLMNENAQGQHELMYQLFFKDMVSLLERFARIHRWIIWSHESSEALMWSGLQGTSGFQKLSTEEQREVEVAILHEKGIRE